ncbi:hypothetical protein [Bacillus sp. UNCCL81]|uniref:hypothetical protein n=1 Tax=Bacillus sp. UNCCL81 TaxID=1502755 RepID=UPI0008F386D7|nr:hypothetical protein [Bacillus sp. UNCCL81]SFC42635.1 hypothetical protein SAMN02799633_00767 [Bacillus sp. UNCCL81]
MRNLILIEINNCINRREFKFIFAILLILSCTSFFIDSIAFYGQDLSFIRSSAEQSLIQSTYSTFLLSTLLILLPLLSSSIYADSYYTDYKNGVLKNILSRIDHKSYIKSKVIVIFIMTFITFFISLTINQILVMISFPLEGFDNKFSLPAYDYGIQNYSNQVLFDLLRMNHPLLYNFLNISIISLFSGIIGVLSFSIYFINSNNRITNIIMVFIVYIISELFFSYMHASYFSLYNQLKPGSESSITTLVIWSIGLLVVSIYILYTKGNKLGKEFGD